MYKRSNFFDKILAESYTKYNWLVAISACKPRCLSSTSNLDSTKLWICFCKKKENNQNFDKFFMLKRLNLYVLHHSIFFQLTIYIVIFVHMGDHHTVISLRTIQFGNVITHTLAVFLQNQRIDVFARFVINYNFYAFLYVSIIIILFFRRNDFSNDIVIVYLPFQVVFFYC
jgi:hypothetical protein